METKKEKTHQDMGVAEVIVELIYFMIFRGARALQGGDQIVCCL